MSQAAGIWMERQLHEREIDASGPPIHTLELVDIAPTGVSCDRFRLLLDGVAIKGVCAYSLDRATGEIATLTITLNVSMNVGDSTKPNA